MVDVSHRGYIIFFYSSSEWLIEMASEAISKELSDCLTMEDPPEFRNQLVEDFVSVILEALSNGKDDDQSWLLEATARKILLSVIKGTITLIHHLFN